MAMGRPRRSMKTNGEMCAEDCALHQWIVCVCLRWQRGKSSNKLVKAWPWIIGNDGIERTMASNRRQQDLCDKMTQTRTISLSNFQFHVCVRFLRSSSSDELLFFSPFNGFHDNCAWTISRQARIRDHSPTADHLTSQPHARIVTVSSSVRRRQFQGRVSHRRGVRVWDSDARSRATPCRPTYILFKLLDKQ